MATLTHLVHELLGIHLTKLQVDAFHFYETELKRWNENINLTRILDSQDILVQHFPICNTYNLSSHVPI